MEKAWLTEQLEAGRSIESIAREVGRDPSTVAYWAQRHGLHSSHADRAAARGALSRDQLAALVEEDLTVREMAARLDRSFTTVRHWLRYHGLQTSAAARRVPARGTDASGLRIVMRPCRRHGVTRHVRRGGSWRCSRCGVARSRRGAAG
jgi:transposase-like protein